MSPKSRVCQSLLHVIGEREFGHLFQYSFWKEIIDGTGDALRQSIACYFPPLALFGYHLADRTR
eukprot:scaffold24197_cov223-Skeletonema_menzelii.AAC.1